MAAVAEWQREVQSLSGPGALRGVRDKQWDLGSDKRKRSDPDVRHDQLQWSRKMLGKQKSFGCPSVVTGCASEVSC